tara:strand:- start:292 stop:447 length:156 start_codon:yes stop_codon:yes gene_type:complete
VKILVSFVFGIFVATFARRLIRYIPVLLSRGDSVRIEHQPKYRYWKGGVEQ